MPRREIEECLRDRIVRDQALSGGDIHSAARIETASGKTWFVKFSDKPGCFEAEADGLHALAVPGVIRVPEIAAVGDRFLILEYIERVETSDEFFGGFGRRLARLHRTVADKFGYHHDNFIGRLPQVNRRKDSLAEFFGECRLIELVRLGRTRGRIDRDLAAAIERLAQRLDELFAPIDEPPALLHGDLWGGNYLAAETGAVLIDPAVYFGPREADLAMTRLFGGFDRVFYESYEQEFPLPDGWRERVDLFNLYHLLTHTIMFGGGYASRALAVARRYA